MKVEMYKIEEIAEYNQNSRLHSAKQITAIEKSMRKYGNINPILISDTNVIISGHGRFAALKKMGVSEIPCIKASHLTEKQISELNILDNKIAEDSTWDLEKLELQLEKLDINFDFDIDLGKLKKLDSIKEGKVAGLDTTPKTNEKDDIEDDNTPESYENVTISVNMPIGDEEVATEIYNLIMQSGLVTEQMNISIKRS